jgi:hypothetical protein
MNPHEPLKIAYYKVNPFLSNADILLIHVFQARDGHTLTFVFQNHHNRLRYSCTPSPLGMREPQNTETPEINEAPSTRVCSRSRSRANMEFEAHAVRFFFVALTRPHAYPTQTYQAVGSVQAPCGAMCYFSMFAKSSLSNSGRARVRRWFDLLSMLLDVERSPTVSGDILHPPITVVYRAHSAPALRFTLARRYTRECEHARW